MEQELESFLDDAASRRRTNFVQISIRDLLGKWGAKRRGVAIVEKISGDLDEKGLITDPPFTDGWIDTEVRLIPTNTIETEDSTVGKSQEKVAVQPLGERQQNLREVALRVRSLRSSSGKICSVPPDADIQTAQSLMMQGDYSQLAVTSGKRDLRGAVSLESIAQAQMVRDVKHATDACVPAQVVELDDDLLALIPRIIEAGFVFVRDLDKSISGIVTTADLSAEFATLATPFFLVGEIERRLRRAIDLHFSPEELKLIRNEADGTRTVQSADDLTVGEYVRLLGNPANWERLSWKADRKIFIETLEEFRNVRNEIMHFSPDPIEEDRIDRLRYLIRWLRLIQS
ncbi:CBS domain-containing protein [Candidatus Protofrankia californiensis]|uniref:CBS domain-containing protein n=1 Tax=Candidatus Protofrankia californiensis TaxID=1839754 RepID=UPI001040FE39|nr:CBS domain-containing protein [Candidatus Protofrankia californiensis]